MPPKKTIDKTTHADLVQREKRPVTRRQGKLIGVELPRELSTPEIIYPGCQNKQNS